MYAIRSYYDLLGNKQSRGAFGEVQLEAHYRLLIRWNQKLNLTRIASLDAAVKLHYCESLLAGLRLPSGPLKIVV